MIFNHISNLESRSQSQFLSFKSPIKKPSLLSKTISKTINCSLIQNNLINIKFFLQKYTISLKKIIGTEINKEIKIQGENRETVVLRLFALLFYFSSSSFQDLFLKNNINIIGLNQLRKVSQLWLFYTRNPKIILSRNILKIIRISNLKTKNGFFQIKQEQQ